MSNLFEYLKWRGDLDIEKDGLNEVDNLILSRFSYFPLEKVVGENETITIQEAERRFWLQESNQEKILQKEDLELFPRLAKTKRFCDLQITCCCNHLCEQEEKQFFAITILLPKNQMYIAYRGTDNTLIGWKEDFNMSFRSHVPSQQEAVKYLEYVAKQYKQDILIGGHSKGGNLAIYAAIFCSEPVKNRIQAVYNHDGPGFDNEIIGMTEYKTILNKVHTYIPQSSVVGRLLNRQEQYIIVKSTQTGLMQHDLYSWQVEGTHFIYEKEVTNGSLFFDKMLKQWLGEVTPEQRGECIDILYQILNKTNAKTINELSAKWFSNARIVLATYQNIDAQSKIILSQTLYALFQITKSNILGNLPKLPEEKKHIE